MSTLCFRFPGRLCRPFLLKKSGILWADEGSSGIVFTGGRSVEQAQQVWPHLRILILGNPMLPKHKIACWEHPKPLCRKDGAALWQIANAPLSCAVR